MAGQTIDMYQQQAARKAQAQAVSAEAANSPDMYGGAGLASMGPRNAVAQSPYYSGMNPGDAARATNYTLPGQPSNGATTGTYNPAQGMLHEGNPAGGAANVLVGPNGQVMSAMSRDREGRLVMRPGEQGYTSGFQRVDTSQPAQQLGQAAGALMQRGLGGATLAGMPQVQADRMRAAQINQSGFNQQAMAQNALAQQGNAAIGQLQGAAAGTAPSVAAIQQAQGLDAAQQQAMAMAASARGGADQRAAAMRQGQMAGAQLGMQGVQQAAALRANEMANARGQLVSAIGQQQGLAQQQGVNSAGLAQAQAGLNQQAGLANQGSNLQAGLANQQGYLAGTGMDLNTAMQGANLYGQGAGLGMQGANFNNQALQSDYDIQMQQQQMAQQRYQIDQARQIAQDQAKAGMIGAGLGAAGQVLGLGVQAFGA